MQLASSAAGQREAPAVGRLCVWLRRRSQSSAMQAQLVWQLARGDWLSFGGKSCHHRPWLLLLQSGSTPGARGSTRIWGTIRFLHLLWPRPCRRSCACAGLAALASMSGPPALCPTHRLRWPW